MLDENNYWNSLGVRATYWNRLGDENNYWNSLGTRATYWNSLGGESYLLEQPGGGGGGAGGEDLAVAGERTTF